MNVLLPALTLGCVLVGLRARINVYDAFVRGAKEGLHTLIHMTPYLCAIVMVTALLRDTGALRAAENLLSPMLCALGLPPELTGLLLLRPLSGSASLAAAAEVMARMGADSRTARLGCVICGASETIFFTGALYLGETHVRHARYAIPTALLSYLAGVLTAGALLEHV